MLDKEFLSALICPTCGGKIKQCKFEKIVCLQCGQKYSVKNGISILLKNPEKSLSEVKQMMRSRPTWYRRGQIELHDKGPYRHHFQKRAKYLFNVFNRYNFTAPRIYDAGCGDGINLRYLIRYFINVPNVTIFGLDSNLIRLMRAQKNSNNQVFLVLGNLLERNFKENYFDIVLCNHVLEHIEKDLDVLVNLHRILKPGGILILGTPNEGAFLWQLNYKKIQPRIMQETGHIHFYIAKKLARLLKKANFEIEEVKSMGWGLPHTGIDQFLRQYKWIDDLFEIIGSRVFKSQATSLYFICKKTRNL